MKKVVIYRVVKDNTILGTFIFRPDAVAFQEANGGEIVKVEGYTYSPEPIETE